MNHQQAAERFEALSNLVEILHDLAKTPKMSLEDIADRFFRLIGLGDAFNADCVEYMKFSKADGENVPVQTLILINNIGEGLQCTALHLEQAASNLKSNILRELLAVTNRKRKPDEFMMN